MTKHRQLPPQERIRELFTYSFVEGALYWNKRLSPKSSLNTAAGFTDFEGYRVIGIDRVNYRRHRLVWAYFNGDPGSYEIDHVNRIKGDDRLENLRLATRRENSYNTIYSGNKSGFPGVCWHKRDKRWRVSIKNKGVNCHIGYFTDFDEAKAAYLEASLALHKEFSICATGVAS